MPCSPSVCFPAASPFPVPPVPVPVSPPSPLLRVSQSPCRPPTASRLCQFLVVYYAGLIWDLIWGRWNVLSGTIEDFGGRVATVWSELRPITRKLVERALQPNLPAPSSPVRSTPFDARSDMELSRLLTALDEGVAESDAPARNEHRRQLRAVADTCAAVLQEKTQSAEVFVQLVVRAELQHDYRRIDSLADALSLRFAPSEICELARSQNIIVRALAHEALSQVPTNVLIGILHDPVDSEIAREALQRQARDFGSEQARQIMQVLEQMDVDSEEM